VLDRGNGHLQITGGPLLVNYYPMSKGRTAYVAGTTRRHAYVSPEDAVAMAFAAPPKAYGDRKSDRVFSGQSRNRRKIVSRLRGKNGDNCHWCKEIMVFYGDGPLRATIEHVIPLDRGGLDNPNNIVLAHKKCNHKRGSDMPELEDSRADTAGSRAQKVGSPAAFDGKAVGSVKKNFTDR
jgi:hypothetical protein